MHDEQTIRGKCEIGHLNWNSARAEGRVVLFARGNGL